MGPKQTLQRMAGRTNFPPTIPFPLLFMMLLKLGNLWNFNQIKFLILTVHNRSRKYKAQYLYSTVRLPVSTSS